MPNDNHRVLATLADRRLASIVTTNFDELIEREISTAATVTKLHGTISNLDDLVMRLSQIGRGLMSGEFSAEMHSVLSERSVCFIGYAGRDPDIFPRLCKLRLRTVIWIARPYGSLEDCAAVDRELKHCDRLARSVGEFECISVDANSMFDALAARLGIAPSPFVAPSLDWRRELRAGTNHVYPDEATIAVARTLAASGKWRQAAEAYSWLRVHGETRDARQDALLYEAESRYG